MDTPFRGNSRTIFELGEAGFTLLLECRCIDVQNDLVALGA